VASNPDEPSIRETLADLYLKQGNADRALEMLSPLAERALAKGERGSAVEMLNRILRVDSGHTPTLERLVGLYMRLNEETNILASMNSLAEAHVAKGSHEQAAKVLERLIQREPQNAQHRNKLQFVRSQMGGVDTMPAKPKAAEPPPPAPPPVMEIEEPMPAIDSFDDGALTLDLNASEGIELDLSADFDEPSIAAPPPVTAPPPPRFDLEQEAPAAEEEEENEDLDFITEHLTEAEVFAKYGLAEKAAEHLRAVIERAPKHTAAHEKLYRILLDEGDIEGARNAANAYLGVLLEKGDSAAIDAVRNEFTSRGQSLSVPAPKVRTPTIERPVPPPPAPEPEPEFADFGAPDEISFDLDAGTPSLELEQEVASSPLEIDEEISFDTAEPALEIADEVEQEIEFAPSLEPPAAEPEPVVEETFFGVESEAPLAFADAPTAEEIGEVDFYIEQELFDEAREKLESLSARFDGNADVRKREQRLATAIAAASAIAAAAPAPAAPQPAAPLAPPVLSRDEIESELLSALPDDDDDFGMAPAPAPPPPAMPIAPPPSAAAAASEENLFSDEDNFFDLAAELESELEEEGDQIALSEEEQSLEEIFKEFKKGVEQQLDSEDYDTHYNLGIAYKEMGLIDEAIGEFQLASKDPKRAVECASMLGLCFLEKGMPQLAIKWYRKGLEMPEINEEEHVGLLYDLGNAYVEVGDTQNAQKAFMEVYGMNTNYRDVVGRIKQLEGAT